MREKAGSAPEQFFSSGLLESEEVVRDLFESRIRLREIAEFRSDVAVVPAIVIDAGLIEELEEDVSALEGVGNGVGLVVPRHQSCRATEGIGETVAHHVPVSGGEAAMLLHRFPGDDLIGIVLLERKGILGLGAFELDFRDIGKKRHGLGLWGGNLVGKCEKRENRKRWLIRPRRPFTNSA